MDIDISIRMCTGTAGFAAPEQYEGKINAATDIYTFGKTLAVLCKKSRFSVVYSERVIVLACFQVLHEETRKCVIRTCRLYKRSYAGYRRDRGRVRLRTCWFCQEAVLFLRQ